MAGLGTASGGQAQTGKVDVVPGSRPYVRVAEVGYLVQVAFIAYSAAQVFVVHPAFANELTSESIPTAIGLVVSVAWLQLGRRQRVPWFTAAGGFGIVSAAIALYAYFELYTVQGGYSFVIAQAESLISLVYFATQLLAFYTAAKTYSVKLFMYATYSLAIGFVVAPIGAVLLAESFAMAPTVEGVANLTRGIGLVFSAATSLTAALGFHRVAHLFP